MASRLISPLAAKAPSTKINESPGRKGVTTKPVSAKITKNKIRKESRP
jgi:hypothetical protein